MNLASKKTALRCGVALVALVWGSAAWAQTKSFDVPSEDAVKAIPEFARQAGIQIVAPADQLKGVKTPALIGALDLHAALSQLLAGTGIEVASDDGQTIVLRMHSKNAEAASNEGAANSQNVTGSTETVVVTGSRLRREAGDEGAAPVTVFDRKAIEQLGVSNVADVLAYLPQQPFSVNEGNNFAGARFAQIRGLGLGNTLVLINGRRTVTSALEGPANAFDLSTIPLSAVARVEVLSDSASAVYGADAVGGVVNIILKTDIENPQLDLYYGGADGGANEHRASFSVGYNGDRLRASLALDYFDRSFLMGSERDLFANGDFRRFGGTDTRSILASPGNISAISGNLPGLSSSFAAVPVGSSGVGLTPASFAATAGTRNLESLGLFRAIVPEEQRYSAIGSAEYDLTAHTTVFAEVLATKSKEVSLTVPPFLISATVPASNAFNPFGTAVRVTELLTGLGNLRTPSVESLARGVLGAKGDLGSWDWEVSLLATSETANSQISNNTDPNKIATALASSNPAQAFNPFQDGPGASASVLASLLATPTVSLYGSRATQGAGFIRGSLFALPAGDVQVVLGAEGRIEHLLYNSGAVNAQRQSESIYAEANIPLVSEQMGVNLVQKLAVTAAVRWDNYSDFGNTVNPEFGVEWKPDSDLLFRASYGTSFRAPSLFELHAPITSTTGIVADPRRGNQQTAVTIFTGGNPNLRPETADSWSAGSVYSPSWDAGLRMTFTYWNVQERNRNEGFNQILILANEGLFPTRIIRASPTAADVAAGFPGQLVSIDTSTTNFGTLKTDGVDAGLSQIWTTDFGEIDPDLRLTWVNHYTSTDVPGQVAVDRVGIASSQGTIPRWRGVATLGWSQGAYSAAFDARYTSSYKDVNTGGALTGMDVSSLWLFDLQGAVDVGKILDGEEEWASGSVLRVGAINLFDRHANFSQVSGVGYDPSQADNRQRFIYVAITKQF